MSNQVPQNPYIEMKDKFEEDLSCLNDLILRVYKYNISPEVKKVFADYREKTTVNTSASEIMRDAIREGVRFCLTNISKPYRKKLLKEHYSTEGLVFYITTNLQQLVDDGLLELVSGESQRS